MAGSNNRDKSALNLVDPELELIDPNPDIHQLFILFNDMFFAGALGACTVEWSKKLTSCAGVCQYYPDSGLVTVRLSEPLLKLRPRSDLIETMLHEMIHAYLFATSLIQDHDGHGPQFQYHMNRINQMANTNITVFHNFHNEVKSYQNHVWRCNGPCRLRPPFYGYVRRAMNRAPGTWDYWWDQHRRNCSGQFIKISEPEKKEEGVKKSSSSNVIVVAKK